MAKARKKSDKKLWVKVAEIQEIQFGWRGDGPDNKVKLAAVADSSNRSNQSDLIDKRSGKKGGKKLAQGEVVGELQQLVGQVRSLDLGANPAAKRYQQRIAELEAREDEQKRELKRLRKKNKRLRARVKELKSVAAGAGAKGMTLRDALEQFENKRDRR